MSAFPFEAKITGVGHYVPEQVVSNAELIQHMNTSEKWITERTGIQERHFFKEGEDTVSKMGSKAALMALKRAGLKAEDVDMIVLATLSPDYNFPGSGVLMQRELGLSNIPALDIRMQCSGFIYALSIAQQYIRTVSPQSPFSWQTVPNPMPGLFPEAHAWTWSGLWEGAKSTIGYLIPCEDFIVIGEQLIYLMNRDWENFDAT